MNKFMLDIVNRAQIISDGPHDRYESDPSKVAENAVNAVLDEIGEFLKMSSIKYDINDSVEEWDRGYNAGLNQAWIVLRKYRD